MALPALLYGNKSLDSESQRHEWNAINGEELELALEWTILRMKIVQNNGKCSQYK
jgi:hypothetical protein